MNLEFYSKIAGVIQEVVPNGELIFDFTDPTDPEFEFLGYIPQGTEEDEEENPNFILSTVIAHRADGYCYGVFDCLLSITVKPTIFSVFGLSMSDKYIEFEEGFIKHIRHRRFQKHDRHSSEKSSRRGDQLFKETVEKHFGHMTPGEYEDLLIEWVEEAYTFVRSELGLLLPRRAHACIGSDGSSYAENEKYMI